MSEGSCRYCLSEDAQENLISPCICTGTTSMFIVTVWSNGSKLKINLFLGVKSVKQNISTITVSNVIYRILSPVCLFIICVSSFRYVLVGVILTQMDSCLFDTGSYWKNVFLNGYIVINS